MPLPALAFFPWLVGLFSSTIAAVFTFFASFFALRYAAKFTVVTAYLIAIAALTAAVAAAIKLAIFGIQVSMPNSLGIATYFLPANINAVIGAFVSIRVSFYLYRWTSDRLTAYVRLVGAS